MGGSLLVDGQALASPHPHLTQWTRESYLGPTLPPFRWFQLLRHSMVQKYGALFRLVLIYLCLFVTIIWVFSTVVELSNSDNALSMFSSWKIQQTKLN